MNYVAQSRSPNAPALLGALAIPAGVGAMLIAGLAVTYVLPEPDKPLTGVTLEPIPIDPPPPPPEKPDTAPKTPQTPTATREPTVPERPVIILDGPTIDLAPVSGPIGNPITLPGSAGPIAGPIAGPPVAPSLPDPIAATPRGNPGSWITESDYRSRWIREGRSGVASFTLEIDARGRVSDCTITRSTGHDVLDGATCRLLTRRARFNPARGPEGEKIAGTYSSSVAWEIP
ncbi:MAG: TonB family protein [Erythrobacter sp.]|uniref:TonB family protein n=1 Tax=Erythrobacter sp. TaxID=1042 RepID=UPI00260C918D|nr:TonB family protein [Erythrobacter sp.]MDJ0976949.1 TonB family protein [Erythrobacter sp.]